MEKKSSSVFKNELFIFLLMLAIFALVGLLSIFFNFSLLFAFGASFIALAIILFTQSPLALLFLLIVTRMSLDYSSDFIYFQITRNVSVSLSQFTGILIAFLGVLLLIFKRNHLKKFPLWWPFGIIFVWGTLTLFYSISPSASLQDLVRFFDLFALSALAYISIQSLDDFKKLIIAFFVSSILPVAFGIYQLIFHIGFQDDAVSIPRIFGTFSHPNVLSLYIFGIISLAFLYKWALSSSRKTNLILNIFILFNGIILYLTYTRIAWVALAFFLVVISLIRFRKLLLPLILIPVVLLLFSSSFQKRVDETLHPPIDSSITWRMMLWKDAINKTRADQNILTGYGMNTFPLVSESARGVKRGSNDPHNDFVKFFVEGGLLGLGVFLIYLGLIAFLLFEQRKMDQNNPKRALIFEVLLVMFLAIVLSSFSDNIFKNTPLQWIFWIILGGSLALAKKSEKVK